MSLPKRVIIEYDDGSRKETDFGDMEWDLGRSLAGRGASALSHPSVQPSKSFLLLRWKSGWQEVLAVENRQADFFRYYVIERVEEIGRLVIDVGGSYPELFLVRRLPGELESTVVIDDNGARMYRLSEKALLRSGDTTEHLFYDKNDDGCVAEDPSEAERRVNDLRSSLTRELSGRGLAIQDFLAMGIEERIPLLGEISASIGLRAMEKQSDLIGFMETLLGVP